MKYDHNSVEEYLLGIKFFFMKMMVFLIFILKGLIIL